MPQASSLKPIALVSAPWPLYNRPSIQLGALKAHLNTRFPDLTVNTFHLYLHVSAAIGYPVYSELSQRMWLAESVYAALLNPEQQSDIRRFYQKHASGKKGLKKIAFGSLVKRVRRSTHQFMARIKWNRFAIHSDALSINSRRYDAAS